MQLITPFANARLLLTAFSILTLGGGAAACFGGGSSGSGDCPVGQERCACTAEGTCDTGLVCASNHCVQATASGSGGTSTGGNGGTTAATGGTEAGASGGATSTAGAGAVGGGDAGSSVGGTGGTGTGGTAALACSVEFTNQVWFPHGFDPTCKECIETTCCTELQACDGSTLCKGGLKPCLESSFVAISCIQGSTSGTRSACLQAAGVTEAEVGCSGNVTCADQISSNLKACVEANCSGRDGCQHFTGNCDSATSSGGGTCTSSADCCAGGCCECEDGACRTCIIGSAGLCTCP